MKTGADSSILPSIFPPHHSSVPSANQVLVPETLLKKRKSDAKSREEKAAKASELRKVRILSTSMRQAGPGGRV